MLGWPHWTLWQEWLQDILWYPQSLKNHYYPALLKLRNCACIGSNHPSYNAFNIPLGGSGDYATNLCRLLSAPNQSQFEARCVETGITKTPLILGLKPSHSLGVPICMTTDIMHLAGNQGVQHVKIKINTLLTAIPTLDDTKKGLPYSVVDLEDGFVLLWKHDKLFVHPLDGTTQAILQFLGKQYPQAPRIK
ncbi:hypothetical protein BS17DRAFT_769379 [Gyrodon lividus]|nr:hypothetical protein BS17DRAFT_769379 [Gyrodon lividus]